ncbi:hypothetical protein I6F11_17460 [Ensifer sp. NBAIM29]|nr:hypothetical protein [Ensifer sp. NBAIM29]
MRPSKYSWPQTDGSRGILMFAQLMREMLTPTTFESFRVYSLDTIARLIECLQTIGDVKRGKIPPATLNPVFEELQWSLSKDPAVVRIASPEVAALIALLKSKQSTPEAVEPYIKLLLKLAEPTYKNTIEELIIEVFSSPNRKSDLRKLTGFYCSHILNLGYQRLHISDLIERYFFSHLVQRMGRATLERFFREFQGKIKKYIVHAAVTADLGHYLKGLGFQTRTVLALTQDQRTAIECNGMPVALVYDAETLDSFGAMEQCYQLLSAQRAIAYLDPHGMKCHWGEAMYVTAARAQSGLKVARGDYLPTRPASVPTSGNRLRSIRNYARSIMSNFDSSSEERLVSSINTAALARTSANPENQLISLWSAIEVLLSEPRDQPRIVHYSSLIVPCIALRHSRRQIIAIYDELLVSYRGRFRRILEKVSTTKYATSKAFAELMFLDEHQGLRDELCRLLADNPLALHRIWKLRSDYEDPKKAFRTITDHSNRVRWQVHRIYRVRNQLVHAGRRPSYLESVILNLAEYYRSAIATIINHAKVEDHASDIDQVVAEIGIRQKILLSELEADKGKFTAEHLSFLMHNAR